MKKTILMLTLCVATVLIGCGSSRDYTPPTGATGEQIFSAVCSECHKPLKSNVAMILREKVANKTALKQKFQNGSMRMPAFPNIQGEAADQLVDYLLSNSEIN